jgi:hypothetical protein
MVSMSGTMRPVGEAFPEQLTEKLFLGGLLPSHFASLRGNPLVCLSPNKKPPAASAPGALRLSRPYVAGTHVAFALS